MQGWFERPLLATEHAEFDSGAEQLAFAVARRGGLPLAAVLPLLSNAEFEMAAPQLALDADAQAAAKREHLQALAQHEGVQLELQVRRGPEPFAEIVDEARLRNADLIVIRRRGQRSRLANLLVGEMVGKVIAHAPCSVLVAPRGASMWTRGVLVGVDPQDPDPSLPARAAALARACSLPLVVVCVAAGDAMRTQAQRALDEAVQRSRAVGGTVRGEVRVGRAHHELIAAARESAADLLVIGRHGADTLSRAWIGGVAQKVMGLAECPVLVHVSNSSATAIPS